MFFPFPFPFNPVNMANPFDPKATANPFDPNAMANLLNPANIFNPAIVDMFLKGNATHKAGIEIDIPKVTPETKVSDLTVHQFVSLLVQVSKQLSASRAERSPEPVGAFIDQIQKLTAEKGVIDPSAFHDMVKQIHQSIRDQLKSQASPGPTKPSEEKQ